MQAKNGIADETFEAAKAAAIKAGKTPAEADIEAQKAAEKAVYEFNIAAGQTKAEAEADAKAVAAKAVAAKDAKAAAFCSFGEFCFSQGICLVSCRIGESGDACGERMGKREDRGDGSR